MPNKTRKKDIEISRSNVDAALTPLPWDLGNEVLYKLCREHCKHNSKDEIIAKIWLIGRSYAAAIERRKKAHEFSDDFYEKVVFDKIKNSDLDHWLESLPESMSNPWIDLGRIITVQKRLMDLFSAITGMKKRSLASKYLHFHRPRLFFIYDSRARIAINSITPNVRHITDIASEDWDSEYRNFCRRRNL